MINGSPRPNGNTSLALREMETVFKAEGIETEIIQIGNKAIRGCIACGKCAEKGKCVFDDAVNEITPKFEACDGLAVGSLVYFASANATLAAFLTRLFFSTPFDKTMKVGAAAAVARRGGLSAAFDELNKFFTISGMPVASSQYWNSVHGLGSRRGKPRRRGLADHANPGPEYDVPHAEHRTGQGEIRSPGAGSDSENELYPLVEND